MYAIIRYSCLFQYVYSVWAMFASTMGELSQTISTTVKPQGVSCSEVWVVSLPLMMTQWLNDQLWSLISRVKVMVSDRGLRGATSCRWSWELCSRAVWVIRSQEDLAGGTEATAWCWCLLDRGCLLPLFCCGWRHMVNPATQRPTQSMMPSKWDGELEVIIFQISIQEKCPNTNFLLNVFKLL